MFRFFRLIRQRLLVESNFRKYLLYAIGEIVLVVVGILIALQINSWNTKQNNLDAERSLLVGIKEDLIADTTQITKRFYRSHKDFIRNIKMFDSLRSLKNNHLDVKYVDSIFARCIRPRNTFWPVAGTYKTIISNGLSGIIRNKELFKQLQNLYEKEYVIIQKNGENHDELSNKIRYEYRDLMSLSDKERLSFYKSNSLRNDVEFWRKSNFGFASYLKTTREREIKDIFILIEQELSLE